MLSLDTVASYFDGFQEEKFNMTSNVSNVFLQIKQVDLSDSGLYICGYKVGTDSRNFPAVYSATYLKVKGKIAAEFCWCFVLGEIDFMPSWNKSWSELNTRQFLQK